MKRTYLKTISLLVIVSFVSFAFASRAPQAISQASLLPPQRGMCYVTWDKDRFASKYSDESLQKLSSLGVEYLSVCVTKYQEEYNSTEIKETERTPSDNSIKHLIKKAHGLGLKIMLKPHVDLINKGDGSYWRADIGFYNDSDWDKWFKEYKNFITHYAEMAEKFNVELLCIGTELSFTTQKNDKWKEIISAVKKVYSGKLVYAANWDNFKNISFWDDLDYIGIDAYFPLSYNSSPELEDLKKGWQKWASEIENLHKRMNKPVIFTEIGYASIKHAPANPWENGTYGTADQEIQAKCYQAFFETIWQKSWLAGVYWWKWDTNTRSGGKNNRRFTPQNKPAQNILEAHYKNFGKTRLASRTSEEIDQRKTVEAKMAAQRSSKVPIYGEMADAQKHNTPGTQK